MATRSPPGTLLQGQPSSGARGSDGDAHQLADHAAAGPNSPRTTCGPVLCLTVPPMIDQPRDEPPAEQLLRVAVRREGTAIVVVVDGDVDPLTVARLRAAVDEALGDAAGRPVIVDLTAVTYLGSHGLAALVEAASTAQGRREPLRLVVDETRAVIRPMQLTGLDEVLALYYTVQEALPQ
jgi:anti-sigma B factor antagonist